MAARFSGPGLPYEGLAERGKNGARWTGKGRFVEDKLREPLSWKKPQRIFVDSMSDLFFDGFSFEDILRVFGVMQAAKHHTFQVLTKRPARALEFFAHYGIGDDNEMPSNVWLGVSAEDQQRADERIPLLLQAPAAVRFVSYEPALGPVDFNDRRDWLTPTIDKPDVAPRLDWIIVGGESGPGARPFDIAWARSVVEQCKAAGVACFVKQMGKYPVFGAGQEGGPTFWPSNDAKGGDWSEWPDDLRVREFPTKAARS